MNLFPLDSNLEICAQNTVDKHVIKIITEANQVLSNCLPLSIAPYKKSHYNHPISKWVRESKANFEWTISYCEHLCSEYTFRYNKIHKGQGVLDSIRHKSYLIEFNIQYPTKMPRCFGNYSEVIGESDSIIDDYRKYYLVAKSHLFVWKNRKIPDWIKNSQQLS